MSDEAEQAPTETRKTRGRAGGGLGLLVGVVFGWIVFDNLALGLLIGMFGLTMGTALGTSGSKEPETSQES